MGLRGSTFSPVFASVMVYMSTWATWSVEYEPQMPISVFSHSSGRQSFSQIIFTGFTSFLFYMPIWGTLTCISIMSLKGPIFGRRVKVAAELVRPSGLLFHKCNQRRFQQCPCPGSHSRQTLFCLSLELSLCKKNDLWLQWKLIPIKLIIIRNRLYDVPLTAPHWIAENISCSNLVIRSQGLAYCNELRVYVFSFQPMSLPCRFIVLSSTTDGWKWANGYNLIQHIKYFFK